MTWQDFQRVFCVEIRGKWQDFFQQELVKPYFSNLIAQVLCQYQEKVVYPPQAQLWSAFVLTPFEELKGVLLGQDPYHGENQACGLAFSVPEGQKIPPSLRNILKELHRTHAKPIPSHGNLESWATQGLLLLNTVLTVESGQAFSHSNLGWQEFSDAVIRFINEHHVGVFFFLWGKEAQKKISFIKQPPHLTICSPHPSPLSRKKFIGCDCFKQADNFLTSQKRSPIIW